MIESPGLSIEGVCDQDRHVAPCAVAIDGDVACYAASSLRADQMIESILRSDSPSLVTYGVNYLASLLIEDTGENVSRLYAGDSIKVGRARVKLHAGRKLWLSRGRQGCVVYDLSRWSPHSLAYLTDKLGIEPGSSADRWNVVGGPGYQSAMDLAIERSITYSNLGVQLCDSMTSVGMPRYWRDGPGRCASAIMAGMTDNDSVRWHPDQIDAELRMAYFGGRVEVLAAGEWDSITQIDMNSAYPWAMSQLPDMGNGCWHNIPAWDSGEPYALYRVEWAIPDGVAFGPFPIRVGEGRITYPTTGRGWYWRWEIDAALPDLARYITVREGIAWRPDRDEPPFRGIEDWYAARESCRQNDLAGEGHVIKHALTAMYGKLAQFVMPNGERGKWANVALAGMLTSMVRGKMLETMFNYGERTIAIATDSLTIEGDGHDETESRALGGWKATRGSDALILPSGATHIGAGAARMDRVSGLPIESSRGIDWQDVRETWLLVGFYNGLFRRHRVTVPTYCGIGYRATQRQRHYRVWRKWDRDVIGTPGRHRRVRVLGSLPDRRFRFYPMPMGKEEVASAFVPRMAIAARKDHQLLIETPAVIRENDQPDY